MAGVLLELLLLVGSSFLGGLLVGREEGGKLGDIADIADRFVFELQRDVIVAGKPQQLVELVGQLLEVDGRKPP